MRVLGTLAVGLFLGACAYICHGCYLTTDLEACHFHTVHTIIPCPSLEERENLIDILDAPFHFRGKEGELICFESAKHPYFLKILIGRKAKLPLPKKIQTFLPKFQKQAIENTHKSSKRIFEEHISSLQIAGTTLKKECAIDYIKLNPDPTLPMITLIDGLGLKSTLPLTYTIFALQKKSTGPAPDNEALKSFLLATLDKGVKNHNKRAYLSVRSQGNSLQYQYLHTFSHVFSAAEIAHKRAEIESLN